MAELKETFTNPFNIRCESCGAPADYDIVHQNYHCQYCGATTGLEAPLRAVRLYREKHAREMKESAHAHPKYRQYNCPGCGAVVAIDTGEATADCGFCGTKLVNSGFVDSQSFPELIIPFKLTPEEARAELEKWLEKNRSKEEAKLLAPRLDELQGYYLPYQVIKGPVSCQVSRARSTRRYNCGGFLEEVAVNTSKQLDNLLLNAMEPFDWREIRPFEYGYIAGLRTKLQDATKENIAQRVNTEVRETYLPTIEKTLQTQDIMVTADTKSVMEIPALMPVYVITQGQVQAAVNGQTGRVSVTPLKKEVTHRAWLEPLLTVLFVAGLCEVVPLLLGFHASFELTLGISAVTALIVWAAYEGTHTVRKTIYWQSARQLAKRINQSLTFTDGSELPDNPALTPVFFEKLGGDKPEPVRISFYSGGRLGKALIFALITVFLPNIFACLAFLFSAGVSGETVGQLGQLHHFYAAAWWCFSVPVMFILWIAVARRDVFDYPVLYRLLPDGSAIKVEKLYQTNIGLKGFLHICLTQPFLWITIFVVVVSLGCAAAILD